MEAIPIIDYLSFFDSYRTFEEKYWGVKLNEELDAFKNLKTKYTFLHVKLEDLRKIEAPEFNVFDILRISHYEARVHTPILCNLLDPNGSHEQKDLFLTSFLRQVLGVDFKHSDMASCLIKEECNMDSGRMDIMMLFQIGNKHKAVVIENKIYAADQKEQLLRYYSYLKNDLSIDPEDIYIIYLRPWGQIPGNYTLGDDVLKRQEVLQRVFVRSYHVHIQNWLEETLKDVSSPKVQQTVFQYIKSIQYL